MRPGKTIYPILIIVFIISAGCLTPPNIDEEKAGYIAGIRFLETNPGEKASYRVSDPGGDAYRVYFNISKEGFKNGFAEYYVDKFNRDTYVTPNYAIVLAIEENERVKSLFTRYPNAKVEGTLLTELSGDNKYIWEIRVIANGVNIAVFAFDGVEEKILGEPSFKTNLPVNINTGENF